MCRRPDRALHCDVHIHCLACTPQALARPATLHTNFNAATMMAMFFFFLPNFEPRYSIFEAFAQIIDSGLFSAASTDFNGYDVHQPNTCSTHVIEIIPRSTSRFTRTRLFWSSVRFENNTLLYRRCTVTRNPRSLTTNHATPLVHNGLIDTFCSIPRHQHFLRDDPFFAS
jgi:hypothetical protein